MTALQRQPSTLFRFIIAPKTLIFFAIFYLVFCFSGILTIASGYVYRTAVVSLIASPLILRYGLKWTNVTVAYLTLFSVVLFSALLNNSSLAQLVLFLRVLVFSYLIYYVTSLYLNQRTIEHVLRRCIQVGSIQLPIILVQFYGFDYFPAAWTAQSGRIDFGFGTFNYKTDYALAFFLTLLITFLLFDARRAAIVTSRRWWVISWFTLTVMITNSQMTKIALVMVWMVYFVTHLRFRTLMLTISVVPIVLFTVIVAERTGLLVESPFGFINNIQRVMEQVGDANPEERFLRGNYDRAAAVQYYMEQGISWFGDGPSAHTNALTGERTRGNFGHLFTFYSEVGLLGWLLSILVFFFITFQITDGKIHISWIRILIFLSVNILSFTSNIMNDIGVMLSYCIIARYHLLAPVGLPLPVIEKVKLQNFNSPYQA
jgi:hypothetical protein